MLALCLCLLFRLVFLCRLSVGTPAGHRADRTSQQHNLVLLGLSLLSYRMLVFRSIKIYLVFFCFVLPSSYFLSLCSFLLISGVGMNHGYAPGFIWLASDTGYGTHSIDC